MGEVQPTKAIAPNATTTIFFIVSFPRITIGNILTHEMHIAMLRLFGVAKLLLFHSPNVTPGIVQRHYRSIKLCTVNQDSARSQVAFDVAQRKRQWHTSHSRILPSPRYHGVSVEDFPSDRVYFRLRDWREV
ncbi:TPA: protein DA1 [Klebsiella pneumoniae]|nr:protein DA1 [Klebsiella pneumoniae]HBW5971878.1 protein DA1 [Klebsiella pneumoniae]